MRRVAALAALGLGLAAVLGGACASPHEAAGDEIGPAALLERAERHFSARRTDEALRAYQMAALGVQTEGLDDPASRALLVRALAGAAQVYALQGDLDQAQRWLAQAEPRAHPGAIQAWSATLLARGTLERGRGELAAARSTFAQLFDHAQAADLDERAVQAAHMASLVSEGAERVEWARRAIAAAEGHEDWQGPLYTNLGWLLDEEGRLEPALEAFQRAQELQRRLGSAHAQLMADWAVGRTLRRLGRFDEARVWQLRSLVVAQDRYLAGRTPNDAEWLGRCFLERAELERMESAALGTGPAAERLREQARRDYVRARSLFLEAGAAEAAPELLTSVTAALASLEPSVPEDEAR